MLKIKYGASSPLRREKLHSVFNKKLVLKIQINYLAAEPRGILLIKNSIV